MPFRLKGSYNPPPSTNARVENYIHALRVEATKLCPQRAVPRNLSARQQRALRDLSSNENLVIKKADKGSTIVVLDRKDYIEKGIAHLSDKDTYKELETDTTKEVEEKVVATVTALYQDGWIDKTTAEYLLPPGKVRTQEMYFLTKIHKTPHSERPIVSGCNGPTEKISAYMDHWLQPIAQALPSYVKDSKSFVKLIESTPLPQDCLLCTLDVSSLYTNIPTGEGIRIALSALEQLENVDPLRPPIGWLDRLLGLILYNNVFRFNDKFYLQLQGTAMGTKMAPAYANVFMGALESRVLAEATPSPKIWRRYIDDIFLVWTDTEDSLRQFIAGLNREHPRIKFTSEISDSEIVFLDLCLYKGERFRNHGILDIKTHIKPTNTQQYVHASSCHPPGTGKGLIKGEMLRYLRTNSNPESFEAFRMKHRDNVTSRGYSTKQFEEATSGISFANRHETLRDKTRDTQARLSLCTTYTPHLPPSRIRRLLNKHWHLIAEDPSLSGIFPEEPRLAFRGHKSSKQMLVKARVAATYEYHTIDRNLNVLRDPLPSPSDPPLVRECHKPECLTCPHLKTTPYVRSFRKGTAHNLKISNTLTCMSRNTIYVISCDKCKVQYVGMSSQPLKARFAQHLREIRKHQEMGHNWGTTRLYRHFAKPGHQPHHLQVQPVEEIPEGGTTLKARESHWIRALKTTEPHGLNILN
jgi:hypothetical protein